MTIAAPATFAADAHRVHGMGTTLETPTWPAIVADEAAAVLARFPAAGRMIGLEWHSPRPFSAATVVRTTTGAVVVKRHHDRLRSPAGLAEEHAFIAHVAANGVVVPDVMRTDAGAGAGPAATAMSAGGWTYEVHRHAAGADLYRDRLSWTPFLSHAHARAAGVALARLHDAAAGFIAAPRATQPLVASFTILPAADPLAATEAYVVARPALAGYLAGKPWRRQLGAAFASLGQGLAQRLAVQPPLWTHNDWHPSNLLWAVDGSVATVIDFGLADRTCAVHDLATAIERSAVRWLDLGQGQGQGQDDAIADPVAACALLEGYATVRPLGRADLVTIAALLPLVHVEFALSEIDYFVGIAADPAAALLAWDGYLLGHAAWFGVGAGRDLLQAITGMETVPGPGWGPGKGR